MSIQDRGTITLRGARWVSLFSGASEVHFHHSAVTNRYFASIPSIDVTIELSAPTQREAMAELAGKIDALMTERERANAMALNDPMRADRHDRGWPKAAA